jgi:hypothetical protein
MHKIISAVLAVGLLGSSVAAIAPASAAEVVGIRVGGVGLGFTVGNGHYYDSDHRRVAYTYPSDWKSYHHPQSWYRSHPQWNDQKQHDWYRN